MPRPTIPHRRSTLLDVAEGLIAARGFDAVTVADLARAAGVGKGAVYLEFPSKTAVLDALLTRSMHRMATRTRTALESTPDAELGLGPLYRAGIEALLHDRLMTAAMLDDDAVLGTHARSVDPDRYRTRVAWLRALLGAFADAGAIAPDLDLDDLTLALSSITIGLLSASALIGPLTQAQLAGALRAVTTLVERGAGAGVVADPARVRASLTSMLDGLLAQTDPEATTGSHARPDPERPAHSRGT